MALAAGTKPEEVVVRLLARDPHCVFAFWETPPESVDRFAEAAAAGRIRLRLRSVDSSGAVLRDEPVTPEARSKFLEVGSGIVECAAELAWLDGTGSWQTIAESASTRLPLPRPVHAPVPDGAANAQRRAGVPPVSSEGSANARANTDQLREDGPKEEVSFSLNANALPESPAAEGDRRDACPTLAEIVALAMQLGIPPQGSPGMAWSPSSPGAGGVTGPGGAVGPGGLPASLEVAGLSGLPSSSDLLGASPGRPATGEKGFWYDLNAELIVYGATAPDARLTIDGEPLELRPDGTFTLRFALPDGNYHLELKAAAADGNEERTARLRFKRNTRTRGHLGAQPEPAPLPPPPAGAA